MLDRANKHTHCVCTQFYICTQHTSTYNYTACTHKADHKVLNSTSQQVLSPEAWFTVVLFSQTHRFGGLCLLGTNTTPEGEMCYRCKLPLYQSAYTILHN